MTDQTQLVSIEAMLVKAREELNSHGLDFHELNGQFLFPVYGGIGLTTSVMVQVIRMSDRGNPTPGEMTTIMWSKSTPLWGVYNRLIAVRIPSHLNHM